MLGAGARPPELPVNSVAQLFSQGWGAPGGHWAKGVMKGWDWGLLCSPNPSVCSPPAFAPPHSPGSCLFHIIPPHKGGFGFCGALHQSSGARSPPLPPAVPPILSVLLPGSGIGEQGLPPTSPQERRVGRVGRGTGANPSLPPCPPAGSPAQLPLTATAPLP